MKAYEMITRYAHAVAQRLPQAMRDDVRAELKALLTEELEAKAAGGGTPGVTDARALLANFGSPAAMALNYHTPVPVIDPRDSRLFGKIAAIVLTSLVVLAVSIGLSEPGADTGPAITARLIDETVMAGLKFLGVLLVAFWGIGTLRRRMQQGAWSPESLPPVRDPDAINRPLYALAIGFWSAGLAVLVAGPAQVMAFVSGGAAPPALLEAFAYDSVFAAERALFLWLALSFAIALTAWQVIAGRRSRTTRRMDAITTVILSAILFQIVLAGDIFAAEPANQYMKLAMALFGGWGFVEGGTALFREWRTSRARPVPASS